ncbi:hypothetical protein A7C99_0853 [Trichophyton rubrum]|uniref:Uncharacterized protein n=1 Tax=Trichophyton rubrum TaxID=5551 RepID=A0A178F5H5_TRIRU|nr:hypothetical protein A7C99_0853 [Trichophyton rubrum]
MNAALDHLHKVILSPYTEDSPPVIIMFQELLEASIEQIRNTKWDHSEEKNDLYISQDDTTCHKRFSGPNVFDKVLYRGGLVARASTRIGVGVVMEGEEIRLSMRARGMELWATNHYGLMTDLEVIEVPSRDTRLRRDYSRTLLYVLLPVEIGRLGPANAPQRDPRFQRSGKAFVARPQEIDV